MKVSIIGSGVVGKATGLALLMNGHDVLFYDIDRDAYRNNLPAFCKGTSSWIKAYQHGEILMICVPTPSGPMGACNLSVFEKVIDQFAEMNSDYGYKTLVQKSTCPPGTAMWAISELVDACGISRDDFGYLVCPEFLNAGAPLQDTVVPRKLIIGFSTPEEASDAGRLYQWIPAYQQHYMSYAEAEFAKYANNLFHALLISMWNELQLVSERCAATKGVTVDMDRIAKLTALEPGLESVYRVFGKAWGGACLPKDTRAFRAFAGELGVTTSITNALINVNETMRAEYGDETRHWDELHGKQSDGGSGT